MTAIKASFLGFILGCIFMLFLAYKFMPRPEPQVPPAILRQEQVSNCKAIVTKRTNKDGSVDEIAEFLATNSQSQEVKPPIHSKVNSIFIGAGTNLKGAIEWQSGKQAHEVVTDGKKDHVYYFKYKVLEF